MNKYIISIYEPEEEILVKLYHANLYTQEEFNNIVAECFAKLINTDFESNICLYDILFDVKGYMIDVLGFKEIKEERVIAEFSAYWYMDKFSVILHETNKLIKKYLDKLKEE